ncbi:MAG: UDP-N-acetylglucosamine 2-epimerase (non-hydrolyzing) [Eubacteriales bacterium]|nr:UDP-N-acetylglucosamine 2-epimerase (non-hydrolyzing) [Eubacteriales bacterium]
MEQAKKRLLVVFGTRPEAIKMCPLVNELKTRERFEIKTCVTGQHHEMLQQALRVFDVKPDYDLAIMQPEQTLFDVTARTLQSIKPVLEEYAPALVYVHGDTTTAFASSLAAFYLQIPVAHVEAGLRTKNIYSPFPEEYNRQAISLVAKYHFAPTQMARYNLRLEGKPFESIYVTGNTGIDALRTTVRAEYTSELLDWAQGSRLLLITAHRRENLGANMHHMFRAIRRVLAAYSDVKAVYPVHLNPQVKSIANEELGDCANIRLIAPMDVLDFHNLMNHSYLILTDSGGIQEEAPFLGKPVLVMRETTERPEGVEAGTLRLVGTDEEIIYYACRQLLDDPEEYARMAKAKNPYGDGHASARIADITERLLFDE